MLFHNPDPEKGGFLLVRSGYRNLHPGDSTQRRKIQLTSGVSLVSSSAIVQRSSRSTPSPMVHPCMSFTVPPWTKNTLPVAGQFSVASQATNGETLAGSQRSNAPAPVGGLTM